jgi:CTP synthase
MVIEEQDVENTIYEVPLDLHTNGADKRILKRFGLPSAAIDLSDWRGIVERVKNPSRSIEIALVGKYIELNDAYKSVYEALDHAAIAHGIQFRVRKLLSEDLEGSAAKVKSSLAGVTGILVPGGFGKRGIEGKIAAAQYARENRIPYFGLCLGLQIASIEFARNVLGLSRANSGEFDKDTPDPVIHLMEAQKSVSDMGGTMRLGSYACRLLPGTKVAALYDKETVKERHRHRWEFNNAYRDRFEAAGAKISGVNDELGLAEVIELTDHPFFVGVQFHPEFQSKPVKPHPLFRGFVGAAAATGAPHATA